MGARRALLVSGAIFLAGAVVLGGTLLVAQLTAASLGFAVAVFVPLGALGLLVGGLGLVFGVVAYIQEGRRRSGVEHIEKEDPS